MELQAHGSGYQRALHDVGFSLIQQIHFRNDK